MPSTILIVAAHPDDELLGVGGTAARHIKQGDAVHTLILGQGLMSRDGTREDDLARLKEAARKAADMIGVKKIYFQNFPDNAFDTVRVLDIVKAVERHVAQVKPDVIYTHHAYDLNVDHQLTYQAVLTACRPCNPDCPSVIYTFETLSSTEWNSRDHQKQFQPNAYCDISETLETKINALKQYESEMRLFPHSRSFDGVRILAQYRGLESGLSAAEAFHLVRRIEK